MMIPNPSMVKPIMTPISTSFKLLVVVVLGVYDVGGLENEDSSTENSSIPAPSFYLTSADNVGSAVETVPSTTTEPS